MDRYPLPKVEDLFATLSGGRIFSKLDLNQAYQQVLLEDVSRGLVTINTQKGLLRYTWLSFGVSSAPGIFQRVMEEVLQGIPNMVVYLDDILATSTSEEDHVKQLDAILSQIQAAGLRLRKSKCKFGVSSVTYLGHRIDAEGLHPVSEKVQAVHDAPSPTDVAQLRSYLGLLTPFVYIDSPAQSAVEGLSALEVDEGGGTSLSGLQAVDIVLLCSDAFQSRARCDFVLRCLRLWPWGRVVPPPAGWD